MLVLARKPQTSIFIGPDIEVIILSIDGQQCKIGVIAPKDVIVLRNELKPVEPLGYPRSS